MKPGERWERVTELFSRVYEMAEERRRRELEAIEDGELRAEVEALLATHDGLASEGDGFLEGLNPLLTEALLDRAESTVEGEFVGRYRIVRQLGQGGMGVVYQAHDPVLDRPLALKLLPPFLSADPAAIRRLSAEARAASALDHPQIETVYEIGETDDGRTFIAMAYYDGETLRARIDRGPVPVSDVVQIGTQLAAGLAAAHRAGIVHRDIKPENLLVTREGALKIVDFGVAKLAREGTPTFGLPRGTAAYMSPEQTRGEPVDARSDLWSAGVVLYEMLTGTRPFAGDAEALIHAIRHDGPRPLLEAQTGTPPELAEVIERCMEKERERRPDSADELLDVLQDARAGRPHELAARRRRRSRRPLVVAVAALALVAGWLLVGRGDRVSPAAAGEEAAPAVAVLPFEVRGGDLGIWREGMVDLLSIGLDGAAGLRAIDSRTVIAGWRGTEGGTADLRTDLQIARATGARYAVVGSAISTGSDIRLAARVYSTEDGANLAAVQVEGPADSLFSLADRLSIDILAAIWQGEERPTAVVDLGRITTRSLPALRSFLEGESLLRRADFEGAVVAYEKAVAADSTFAYALYHLGLAYAWVGDAERMTRSYERAERHADRLPEREQLLFQATNPQRSPDLFTRVALLEQATQKYPDDVDAWYYLADAYWHTGRELLMGQEFSERAFSRVVELDPGFAPGYVHLLNNAFTLHPDSARAARILDIYRDLAPDSDYDQLNRIAFALAFGDSSRRTRAYTAFDSLRSGMQVELANSYFDHPRFQSLRVALLERAPRTADSPGLYLTAGLFNSNLALGRLDAAIDHLDDPLVLPGLRSAAFYRLHTTGLSTPPTLLDEALSPSGGDAAQAKGSERFVWLSPSMYWTILPRFYEGAYAADEGRWNDYGEAVTRLRSEAERLLGQGDSLRSKFASGAATALTGRGFQVRGETDRALRLLTAGQRQTAGGSLGPVAVNGTIRWWIGDLLVQAGRPREAVVWFESFWNDPLAAERLAPLYERIGEPAKAREAWRVVATVWRDADPAFQERARAASAALRRSGRASSE